MTAFEFIKVGLSGLSLLISIISLYISKSTSKNQNKISQGQIELQIHQLIFQTKKDALDIALKLQKEDHDLIKQAFLTAQELNLNAYEEACAKYLDDKVDKERFKKNYYVEIRQIVESSNNREKFNPITSKYKCVLKVYNEWYDLEKN